MRPTDGARYSITRSFGILGALVHLLWSSRTALRLQAINSVFQIGYALIPRRPTLSNIKIDLHVYLLTLFRFGFLRFLLLLVLCPPQQHFFLDLFSGSLQLLKHTCFIGGPATKADVGSTSI